MKLLRALFGLRHASPFALTVMCMVGVVLVTVLDQGLSGGSAQDPAYAMGFLAAGGVALGLLAFGPDSGPVRIVARLLGASPLLFVIGSFAVNGYRFENSPEKVERRAHADNIRCAARAAGIPWDDRRFVRSQTNLIADWGDMSGSRLRNIEDRLDITVLPDCGFRPGAPVRKPEPEKTQSPFEGMVGEYQPPAGADDARSGEGDVD